MNPDILLEAHSGLRWLLLVSIIVALVVTVRSLRGKGAGMLNRIVMLLFRILITLQWLLGLVLFMVRYPLAEWTLVRLEHGLTMTLAMGLTHVFGSRRFARPLVQLLLIVAVLALVLISVARLPQGWRLGPSA